MRRHARRAGVIVLLLGALTALVPVGAAHADFASQCSAPTRTADPAATSITVAAGEVVLVASDFSGGIDALPAGGTLCVASGATLDGLYMNNATGALVVGPGAQLRFSTVVVNAGFSLELEGDATLGGFGTNGSANVHVYPGALLVVGSSFSGGGSVVNEGGFQVQGGLNLNAGAVLENSGSLSVLGAGVIDGYLDNSGLATFDNGLTLNGSAALQNTCAIGTLGELSNNSANAVNSGVVLAEGVFRNNGTWQQSGVGVVSAGGLLDDGSITGVGGFRFSGTTSVQGSFVGDSPVEPIRVQTQAPAGQIFDVATGTVANVVRTTVDIPTSLPTCAVPGNVAADVGVTKSGPATVFEGGTVAYELTVANRGPNDAADVVVSDALPTGFVLDPASTTGVLADGTLTWRVGTLGVGDTLTLTFSGTAAAPAGSLLQNVASSTSSTVDLTPSNNDGSAHASQVSTAVIGAGPPANVPPVADDAVRRTVTGAVVGGVVTATDPDVGQVLSFRMISAPTDGIAVLSRRGTFEYESRSDFAGVDSFAFEVCDNASPTPGCDTGIVVLNVYPVAADDAAQTYAGVPVSGPLLANDTDGAALDPLLVRPPRNGTVTFDPATEHAVYTPDAGFIGIDDFEYRICSPTEATFCDTATVVITVVPGNDPPVVEPLALTTTTGSAVTDDLVTEDPDAGDVLTDARGVPPRSGTAQVAADGTTTYTPRQGFAGRDWYGVIVCDDGTPVLCSTGTVTVDVYPVARPDAATTASGTAVGVAVTGNDAGLVTDPTLTAPPANGSVTLTGGVATYEPAPGFAGTDTFQYTICATTALDLCATTTVTVTVTPVPSPDPTPTPAPTPAPVPPRTPGGGGVLAVTGTEPAPVIFLGIGLLVAGGVLVLLARRRA